MRHIGRRIGLRLWMAAVPGTIDEGIAEVRRRNESGLDEGAGHVLQTRPVDHADGHQIGEYQLDGFTGLIQQLDPAVTLGIVFFQNQIHHLLGMCQGVAPAAQRRPTHPGHPLGMTGQLFIGGEKVIPVKVDAVVVGIDDVDGNLPLPKPEGLVGDVGIQCIDAPFGKRPVVHVQGLGLDGL